MGIPCMHMLQELINKNGMLTADDFHEQWHLLWKAKPESSVSDQNLDNDIKMQWEVISKRVQSLPIAGKTEIIAQVTQLLNGQSKLVNLKPPAINLETRGRPIGARNKPKNTTMRDPSEFEYIDTKRRKCGNCGEVPYAQQLPQILIPFIISVKDVSGDGNCGYQALAICMGRPEDDWKHIRQELFNEITSRFEFYNRQSQEHFGNLQEILDHLVTEESPVGKSYWMRMPQLGDGIANAYQRPVHFYSSTGS
ncbi:hypothetical protein OnM2_020097, partial [Erysiphe neolycopersici]